MTKLWFRQNIFHLIIFFLCLITLSSHGQVDTQKNNYSKAEDEDVAIMHKHIIKGGVLAHTNGWGIGVVYGRNKSRTRNTIYSFDYLFALKHPKEVKVVNRRFEQANPYVYGRKNALMLARAGMGQQFRIAEKNSSIGVRVDFNYTVGPNLGLLKPVYLEIIKNEPNRDPRRVVERYNPDEHRNQGVIFGGAPYTRGLGEISLQPGLSAKASLSFAWGEEENDFKSLETGVMVDAFPRKMPIFAYIENKSVFINLYINFSFGTRW